MSSSSSSDGSAWEENRRKCEEERAEQLARTRRQARAKYKGRYKYPISLYPPDKQAKIRKRNSEKSRRRNHKLKAAGLCVQCKAVRDDPNFTWRCSRCQKRVNDNRNSA